MGAPLSWARLRAALRERGPMSERMTEHFIVVGAGGLGCPALLGLVAGGARRITIVDDDRVDLSNLPRQVLYATPDVHVAKVDAARWSLQARAREHAPIEIQTVQRRLDPAALVGPALVGDELLAHASERDTIVLECSDSPRLKFAVHDACVRRGLRVVIGGVVRWHGQAMAVDKTRPGTACYRCLFEAPPPPELAPACEAVGVIGPAAGVVGHAMALLAVGLADRHAPSSPAGTCQHFDLLRGSVQQLAPKPRPDCAACQTSPAN